MITIKKALICCLLVCAGWVHAVEPPITFVSRGGPDVAVPKKTTDDREARYGIGYPAQIGAKKAALFCNLRVVGTNRWDYEDGCDVFIFDDLKNIEAGGPVPISRNEKEKDALTGEQRFVVKYPASVGFWPLGAKRADGTPHPGAGKGFAFCQALSFVGSGEELRSAWYWPPTTMKNYVETMQLAFDGNVIAVTRRDLIKENTKWLTSNGWSISAPGLQSALPDGDDLLMAVTASNNKEKRTGVGRFRFSEKQWAPYSFTPVASGSEPSMARRTDGTFVFTSRAVGNRAKSIELWTAKDVEGTWSQHVLADNIRNASPVTVNATVDGRIFVLGNYPALNCLNGKIPWWSTIRSQLALWQIAEGKAEFNPPRAGLVRDAVADFGVFVTNTRRWSMDHPVAASVQLADGLWHTLIAYRVMAFPYSEKYGELITPHTGCYVEELSALQPAHPPWVFE